MPAGQWVIRRGVCSVLGRGWGAAHVAHLEEVPLFPLTPRRIAGEILIAPPLSVMFVAPNDYDELEIGIGVEAVPAPSVRVNVVFRSRSIAVGLVSGLPHGRVGYDRRGNCTRPAVHLEECATEEEASQQGHTHTHSCCVGCGGAGG